MQTSNLIAFAYVKGWTGLQRARRLGSSVFWTSCYRIYLALHPGVCGERIGTANGRILWLLDPHGRLELEEGVKIYSKHLMNPVGGHRPAIVFVGRGARLKIGARSGFSSSTLVCTKEITIGSDVRIGGGCGIFDSDFHSLRFEERMCRPDLGVVKRPIHIDSGVFIGCHCLVLKGVTIGKESVVGAGSVVTRDIPPGEIWGGNPARFIRKLL